MDGSFLEFVCMVINKGSHINQFGSKRSFSVQHGQPKNWVIEQIKMSDAPSLLSGPFTSHRNAQCSLSIVLGPLRGI
jgi:hypothetical protein